MPVYEYKCGNCGKVFTLLVGVTSTKENLSCQYCNSKNIKKEFSAFSVSTKSDNCISGVRKCKPHTCPAGKICKNRT